MSPLKKGRTSLYNHAHIHNIILFRERDLKWVLHVWEKRKKFLNYCQGLSYKYCCLCFGLHTHFVQKHQVPATTVNFWLWAVVCLLSWPHTLRSKKSLPTKNMKHTAYEFSLAKSIFCFQIGVILSQGRWFDIKHTKAISCNFAWFTLKTCVVCTLERCGVPLFA